MHPSSETVTQPASNIFRENRHWQLGPNASRSFRFSLGVHVYSYIMPYVIYFHEQDRNKVLQHQRQISGTEEIVCYADWNFKKGYVDINCFCPHFIFVLDYSVPEIFLCFFLHLILTATLYCK